LAGALIGGVSAAHFLVAERQPTPPTDAGRAEEAKKPVAADIVRKVRESQAWVGKVKSLSVRFEGTRTTPGGYARVKGKKGMQEPIEIAFDPHRFRRASGRKGFREDERVCVWDGKRATLWYRQEGIDHDNVILGPRPEEVSGEDLWDGTCWLWLQPHNFW